MTIAKPFGQLQLLATKTLTMKNTKPNRTKVADELDTISAAMRAVGVGKKPVTPLTVQELYEILAGASTFEVSTAVIVGALRAEFNGTGRIIPMSKKSGTKVATLLETTEALGNFFDDSRIIKGKKRAIHEPTGQLFNAKVGTV